MFSTLFAYERADLMKPCHFWLRDVGSGSILQIHGEIRQAFDAWKRAQADEQGMVEVSGGMFGGLLGSELDKRTRVPLDGADIFRMAGPFVYDDIGLAFHLWLDNFEPFKRLLDKRGNMQVFAVVGVSCHQTASASSLIRLNGYLAEHLIAFAQVTAELYNKAAPKAFKHDRTVERLAAGRVTTAAEKKKRREEKDRRVFDDAVREYLKHPHATKEEVIASLRAHRLGRTTLEKKIRGAKAQAARIGRAQASSTGGRL